MIEIMFSPPNNIADVVSRAHHGPKQLLLDKTYLSSSKIRFACLRLEISDNHSHDIVSRLRPGKIQRGKPRGVAHTSNLTYGRSFDRSHTQNFWFGRMMILRPAVRTTLFIHVHVYLSNILTERL